MTIKANNPTNSGTEASPRRSLILHAPTILLWIFILAYILFFSAYSLQLHATLNSFAADLSLFDQPMWNSLHERFLERTLGDRQVPRVADHFEPIILPIALVFYLWDDVRAILIIQTLALALGAVPVYWIARKALSDSLDEHGGAETHTLTEPVSHYASLLALSFVVAYLMFPGLQAANVADFHADPLVVTPLLFAFWYATQHRYRAMWAWAVVAMLTKENLPTLTFMLGLYLLIGSEDGESSIHSFPGSLLTKRRQHGLALMAVSAVWFYVASFLIVAPLARQVYGTDGPVYMAHRYTEFGSGMPGLLLDPDRLLYLAGLFASVGWLALLAPEYLLLGLPILIANTLSNYPGQYSGEQHYSAPLAPVFVIAAIYGLRRLVGGLRAQHPGSSASKRFLPAQLQRCDAKTLAVAAAVWLLVWSLGYHYLRGWTPLARDFHWPDITPHHQLLPRFADQIPAEAPLSTTPPLHPHFAHREKIYLFPTIADADFVLLDVSGVTDAHPNDVRKAYDFLVETNEFGVIDAADGYVLLGKGQDTWEGIGTLPDAFFDFARVKDAQPQYPVKVEFDGQLRFLGYDLIDDAKWQQTYLRLYWEAMAPLPDDLRLWPFLFSQDGFLLEDTLQRPMVAPIWYAPSQWKPGEIVVTKTLPWTLGPRFNVGLAVLRTGTDPVATFADPEQHLPITAADPSVITFRDETWAQVGSFARDGRHLAPLLQDTTLYPLHRTFSNGIQLTHSRISDVACQEMASGQLSYSICVPYDSCRPGHLCQLSAQSGESLSVVLQWQATAAVSRSYTVFVHLVDPSGTMVAQSDAQPTWVAPWPTDRWATGQPVLDGHRVPLPPDLTTGRYELRVGLYYWETLERLPVVDDSGQPIGDYVVLSEVEITR